MSTTSQARCSLWSVARSAPCLVLVASALGCGLATGGDRRDPDQEIDRSCAGASCEPGAEGGTAGAGPQRPDPDPPAGVCGDGGVVWASLELSDQQDLDALAGCERVAGNLTLNAFPGMDVAPLETLRIVDGTLSVYGGDAPGTDALAALSALEQAGNLFLQDLQAPSLEPLSRLRRVSAAMVQPSASSGTPAPDTRAAGGLRVHRCSQLRDLSGLESLEELSGIELFDNPALVSLEGMSRVSQLKRLHVRSSPLSSLQGVEALGVQDLAIFDTPLADLSGLGDAGSLLQLALADNRQLTSLEGARLPASMRSVLLSNDDALVDLRGLEGLRELTQLSLGSEGERPALASLSGLETLETVQRLELTGFPLLRDFTGLEGLRQVLELSVARSAGLTSLTGLSGLVQAGTLIIHGSPALSSLAGLASPSIDLLRLFPLSATSLAGLERVTLTGALQLEEAEQLRSLDGLPLLAASANLSIVRAPALEDVSALAALSSFGSLELIATGITDLDALANLRQLTSLYLNGNERLTQIDGASQVSGLTRLGIFGNAALLTLPVFANVRSVSCTNCDGFALDVSANAVLETGPGLPGLEQANLVYFEANPRLSSLSGLAALRAVQDLTVIDNAALTSLSLPSLTRASRVRIRNNPSLNDAPLANLLTLPEGSIKIASNQSGPSLLAVCPWPGDYECDETTGDCAPGSDGTDCR